VNHVAHALLSAIRYSHGRSLRPHEHAIGAVYQLWPMLSVTDRRYWLGIVEREVPATLRRMIEHHPDGSVVPVSRLEMEEELAAHEAMVAWCSRRLGPVAGWPCEACDHLPAEHARGEACRCRCHPPAWPGVATTSRNIAPGGAWEFEATGAATVAVHDCDPWAWLTVEPGGDVVIVVGGLKWRRLAAHPLCRDDAEAWLRARATSPMRRGASARALLVALGWAP
jgi:hypothetical protein